MSFAKRFIQKFAVSIVSLLSCFERVIFKGYLPFRGEDYLNDYVDRVLGMWRKDFLPWLKQHSGRLVESGQKIARQHGRPYEYRQGRFKKETFIHELIRKDGLDVGLVAVLCVQETCSAVKLRYGEGKPRLIFTRRPQRVLYYYWLKMYDKFGLILRVETVINQPREFRVRRRCERNGQSQVLWCPMNKGVVNLPSYQRVARAANERYLEALSVVNDPAPAYQQMSHLTKSRKRKQRTYAGFNPARPDHAQLFRAVLSGDPLLRGFYHAQIREALWGQHLSADQRRRQARKVTRLLKRLHLRGLLAKIPHSRRWRVTALGQQVLGALVQLHYHGLATAL